MKIGIITYYNGNNHGALLQAYALCKFLNNTGNNAEIIRFVPRKNKKRSFSVALKQTILGLKKEKQYDVFLHKFIPCSQKYGRFYDLRKLNSKYDAFITGSDQVFNVNAIDKKAYYYLSFAEKKAISYAASFGESNIDKKALDTIKPYVEKLDAISMREQTGVEIIKKIINKDVTWAIDPTFLLSKEEWHKIVTVPDIKKPYIFAYYNSKKECNEIVKKLAEKLSLDVIVVSRTEINYKSDYIKDFECSPDKFLGYIENAALICSDSFHGTALSVIFRKPFITYVSDLTGTNEADTRKVELLKKIGLGNRLVTSAENVNEEVLNIDYSEAEIKIKEWKNESEKFLNSELN